MNGNSRYIKLVILDIAGTICDGPQDLRHLYANDDGLAVKGPVIVFEQMFQQFGMSVDWQTIRRPMGKFKKEHLVDILAIPEVAAQYREAHGKDSTAADVEEMFDMFRPTMAEVAVVDELIKPFAGVASAIELIRERGAKVGCDTGYPKEAYEAIYSTLANDHGITFDVTADSENVPGRPTPFLVYDCMAKANVFPPSAVVKVDDISAGVREGRNSGAWTVGIAETGADDSTTLLDAGAHFVVPSVAELPGLIETKIEPRLARGETPVQFGIPV
jgi:phosphonoacetaldehyde hydrolase